MANIKVKESERKIMRSFSIKRNVSERLSEFCAKNNISASSVVNYFLENYLNERTTLQ